MPHISSHRVSVVFYFIILIVSLIVSASLGVLATNPQTFAHMANEIYAFNGASVVALTDSQLNRLGNPARVDCGFGACVRGISDDGTILCSGLRSHIFGAGKCEKISRQRTGYKAQITEHGYKCTSVAPEAGCESKEFWEGAYYTRTKDGGYFTRPAGGLAEAKEKAIKDAGKKCCPGGTKVKKGGDGYYCEG
jgi:hypothetical protein